MNKELLAALKKDPEALKQAALEAGLITNERAKELFKPIKVDPMTSTEDLTEQFNQKLAGMQEYFESELKTAKESGVQAAQASSQEQELQKIRDFAKTHPEMKAGSDVTNIMEQLYAKDQDLEKAYKKACRAEGLAPIAITEVDGKEVRTDMSSGKVVDKDGKAVETISSLKSDEHKADTDGIDDGSLKKDDRNSEGKSIRDVAEANWNTVIADKGNPWAAEE